MKSVIIHLEFSPKNNALPNRANPKTASQDCARKDVVFFLSPIFKNTSISKRNTILIYQRNSEC